MICGPHLFPVGYSEVKCADRMPVILSILQCPIDHYVMAIDTD